MFFIRVSCRLAEIAFACTVQPQVTSGASAFKGDYYDQPMKKSVCYQVLIVHQMATAIIAMTISGV